MTDDGHGGFRPDSRNGEKQFKEISLIFLQKSIESMGIFAHDLGKKKRYVRFIRGQLGIGTQRDREAVADAAAFDDGLSRRLIFEYSPNRFVHVNSLV